MVIRAATSGSDAARDTVFASSVSPSGNVMNGFGADSRDNGQSRVPAPPERMIGISAIGARLGKNKTPRIVPDGRHRIDGSRTRRLPSNLPMPNLSETGT